MFREASIRQEGELRRHEMADTVSQIKNGLRLIVERGIGETHSEKGVGRQQEKVNRGNNEGEAIDILHFIRGMKKAREQIRLLEEQEQRLKRRMGAQQEILAIQEESIKILQENKARLKAMIKKSEQVIREQQETINRLLTGKPNNPPKRNDPKGYYKILGLRPDAFENLSKEQIQDLLNRHRRVYSHLYHTDKGGDLEKMQLLNEAYNFLSNPQDRAAY